MQPFVDREKGIVGLGLLAGVLHKPVVDARILVF